MELSTKFTVWSNNHVLRQDIKNFNFKKMFSAPPLSPLLHYTWMPGASVTNPAHGKGHEEGSPTKRKDMIWLQRFPLGFPEHLPPKKTRVGLLYCTVLFTLLTFSGQKLIQGFSLLHMKGMFQLKPLWWLSNLPDSSPGLFTTCELLTAPQPREAQSLKHLKDTEPFLKS